MFCYCSSVGNMQILLQHDRHVLKPVKHVYQAGLEIKVAQVYVLWEQCTLVL